MPKGERGFYRKLEKEGGGGDLNFPLPKEGKDFFGSKEGKKFKNLPQN